jgi:hypothetical protein
MRLFHSKSRSPRPNWRLYPPVACKWSFRHLDGKFVIRSNFRQDFSDHNTFQKGVGYSNRQFTTAANLIYLY